MAARDGAVFVVRHEVAAVKHCAVDLHVRLDGEVDVATNDWQMPKCAAVPHADDPAEVDLLLL